MTTRNPWLGLASYDVPKGMEEDYLFCGRDEETMDIVRLIDNNLFITLYGSSGIGKTSLLKAGVIPILKRKDYFPLYVRLSQESNEISYAEAIVKHLKSCGLTEESLVTMEHADGNDRLFLWNYFATTQFFDADGREIYPVIILDQFEEVFRDGDKAKAELLLQQIYLLLNDELEMPDAKGYSADTNYRFVASIREDYLFVLEDSIDELSLDLYKNNRYRLRPMKPENAKQVVLIPGRDCIEETEKEKVANRVLELAKKPQSDDIDTLLLSLVCAGTFDKKAREKITFGDLSIWKDNPMQIYYQDAMKMLNANQIRYIQQHLIREDGSRKRVSEEELKKSLGENDFQKLTKGKNRLFSIGDKGLVELLHDKLAMAVYEERKAFEERERKKKLRRRVSVIGALILAIAGVFIFQNAKLKQQRWKMLENQSKLVADKAISLAKEDSYLARILALEILPKDLSHPDRPYTAEAERALRKSLEHNTAILNEKQATIFATFDKDGKKIVSCSLNDTVALFKNWDALSGAEIQTTQLSLNNVFSYNISCDGQYFAIVKYTDSLLSIYNTKTGKELMSMTNNIKWIDPLAFSPDGKKIATLAYDSTLLVRSIFDGEELMKVKVPWSNLNTASFSSDGKTLILASSKNLAGGTMLGPSRNNEVYSINKIIVIDVSTGIVKKKWEGHNNLITSISFSPNNEQIVTSSYDGTIKVWDAESGKELSSSSKILTCLTSASFSPDGKHVVSSSYYDGLITIWDALTGEEITTMKGHTSTVRSAKYSPDGEKIVSISDDKTIRIWDVDQNKKTNIIARTNIPVSYREFDINPNGKQVATIFDDTTIWIINVETGEKNMMIKTKKKRFSHHPIAFSHDGKSIISTFDDHSIKEWTIQDGDVISTMNVDKYPAYFVNLSPNGKKVSAALMNAHLGIWDIDKSIEGQTLNRHQTLNAVCFSPDEKQILLSSSNHNIDVISADTYEDIKSFIGHLNSVYFTSFSPDGRRIVSGSADNTLKLWDYESAKVIRTMIGHTNGIYHVSFSSDGNYIVSASADKTIRIWDAKTGACVHIIEGHSNAVSFASFTPDGRYIISASQDSTIRKWDFPPLQELIDQTRERFKDRPLTPEERKMYYLE